MDRHRYPSRARWQCSSPGCWAWAMACAAACRSSMILLEHGPGLPDGPGSVFLSCALQNLYIKDSGRAMIFATTASRKQNCLKWIALGCLAGLILLLSTGCAAPKMEPTAVTFSTPYQAVVLINNSVYYGKLAGYGTSNPVLTDV